ncbi:MAG: hypothetical protein WDN29_07810 [Methylovirgula sp.]
MFLQRTATCHKKFGGMYTQGGALIARIAPGAVDRVLDVIRDLDVLRSRRIT